MQLTQKETDLLKDLASLEKMCAEKYTRNSAAAVDAQLKNLFSQLSQAEQKHVEIIEQLQAGTVPQMSGTSAAKPTFTATYGAGENADKLNDSYLCNDVLAGEKFSSHTYDVCIFEFTNEGMRNVLNQLQKQEQGHGESIYDYMKTNGMY